jgi:hypothetical protein
MRMVGAAGLEFFLLVQHFLIVFITFYRAN